MNASNFMDKQIMDLSRSKTTELNNNNDSDSNDFVDLMNPQSEEDGTNDIRPSSLNNTTNDEILPNYDFQPIHRPAVATAAAAAAVPSFSSDPPPAVTAAKSWNSLDSKSNSTPLRSYNSVDHIEPDRIIYEKSQKANESAIVSEIDQTMKRYIDILLSAIDGLSARLSQLESRTCHLEHSVDELKISVGNSHGSTDGKMRQLENILLEVQNGVHDLKDKQEVMEGHMQLAKLQIAKPEQSPELPKAFHPDLVQKIAASAPPPPQQSSLPQFSVAAPQQAPSFPSNAPSPSQQHSHPPLGTTQFSLGHIPPGHMPPGPQREAYFSPPSQAQEASSQQYHLPPPVQHQQPLTLAPPPQQYQSTLNPPYPQPPQPPQQQPSAVVGASTHISPALGHRVMDSSFAPSQTSALNPHQSASQPSSTAPHSQPYYGNPTTYEPPTGRSSSGFPSAYAAPPGPGEQYPYGGPASHFSSGSSIKAQPHSPVGSSSNYPQLPTAKILPQPIPTATRLGGGSNSGGSGNRVPIDDVVDKVTSMGFPKDLVRETVRKLTENGQSVDLNVVLDKVMNDGDIQPQRAWFGR